MKKISVAYGLPGSGKTTFLKKLSGTYYDFDSKYRRHNIKNFIESLNDGNYVLDFMLFKVNDFINYFFSVHPNAIINIYKFNTERNVCIERDKKRNRNQLSIDLIKSMKLEDIKDNRVNVIEVKNDME